MKLQNSELANQPEYYPQMCNYLKFVSLVILWALCLACQQDLNTKVEREGSLSNTIPVEDCVSDISDPCEPNRNKINIRIQNFSKYDICNMQYNPSRLNKIYGTIEAGGCSCFRDFDEAFDYPNTMLFSYANTSGSYQAIDFVGAQILSPGYYNYNMYIIEADRTYIDGRIIPVEEDIAFDLEESFSCPSSVPENCSTDSTKVNLRIVNESVFDLCGIIYENDQEQSIEFGNLRRGSTSCYIAVDLIDQFRSKIELQIGEHQLVYDRLAPLSIDGTITAGNYSVYIGIRSLSENGIVVHLAEDF